MKSNGSIESDQVEADLCASFQNGKCKTKRHKCCLAICFVTVISFCMRVRLIRAPFPFCFLNENERRYLYAKQLDRKSRPRIVWAWMGPILLSLKANLDAFWCSMILCIGWCCTVMMLMCSCIQKPYEAHDMCRG